MKWRFRHINIDTKQLLSENMLYAMVWITVFLIPILNSKLMSEEHININNILISWIKIAPYFIIFAINNSFIARRLFVRKRYISYLITVIALLGVVFAGVDLYQKYVEGNLFGTALSEFVPRYGASVTDLQWYWNMLLGLFMLGMHDGIILVYKSIADERRMEVLKRQNLQAEMDYLKYQINPHFFMNTLNNIHALIDIDTDHAKKSVIELSKMMRYVLYESGAHELSLQNELTFVENYINLMRIRYTSDIEIVFNRPQHGTTNVFIPPLLFIVFVENAFKHGVSYKSHSFIHIDVRCADREVRFAVENSRHADSDRKGTGIGLDNVKKRLDLIYGDDYTLRIDTSNPDIYRTELIIPVSK